MAELQHYAAYAMLAVGAMGLAWTYGGKVLGGIKLPSFGFGGGDDDTADFQALARLQHRFERLECKEGMDACTTALTHFFHGHPGQP